MRVISVVCVAAVLALSVSACGGNKEAEQAAKAAEEAQKTAEQAASARPADTGSLQDMAKGMEQFAQGMQQLQSGPDGKSVEVIAFRELQNFLPTVPGWEREEPRGEMMSAPVKFSQAEVAFTNGDARVEVRIVDTAMSQLLTLPYQMFLMANYARETSGGYEKAVKVGGFPGWEKWDSDARHAEVGVIVGQRFLVTAEGNNVDSAGIAKDVISKIDLGKLAGLK